MFLLTLLKEGVHAASSLQPIHGVRELVAVQAALLSEQFRVIQGLGDVVILSALFFKVFPVERMYY